MKEAATRARLGSSIAVRKLAAEEKVGTRLATSRRSGNRTSMHQSMWEFPNQTNDRLARPTPQKVKARNVSLGRSAFVIRFSLFGKILFVRILGILILSELHG